MTHRTDDTAVIGGEPGDGDARETDVQDLLTDPHCRYLLQYLDDADEPVAVSAAARYVVGQITDTDPDEVAPDVQRRVQTWLHHGQLPALADHGVVAFDPEEGTVRLGGAGPR